MPICRAFTPIRRFWRSSRRFRIAAIVLGAFAVLWSAWEIVPHCMADPLAAMTAETPVRIVYAPGGECIGVRRTCDWQWRRPVPLEKISPHVVKVILAAEDARFFAHRGVDYLSSSPRGPGSRRGTSNRPAYVPLWKSLRWDSRRTG